MAPSQPTSSHQNNHPRIQKPKDLFIYRCDDTAFWLMPPADQEDEPAELLQATRLEVTGSVEKTHPLKKYQVGFIVSLKPNASGWDDTPVCVMAKRGELGQYAWKIVNLSKRKANKQFVIPENFVLDEDPFASDRNIYFRLLETWKCDWKCGLLIHQAFVKEQPFVEEEDSGTSTQEGGTSDKSVVEYSDPKPSQGSRKSTQEEGASEKSVREDTSSKPSRKLCPSTTIVYPADLTFPNNEDGTVWKIPLIEPENEPAQLLRNDQGIQISCMVKVDPLKTYQVGFKLSAPPGASAPYPLSNLEIGAQRGKAGPLFESCLGEIFDLKANEQRSVPADLVLSADPHASSNRLYLSLKSKRDVQKGGLLLHHAFVKEVNTELRNYLQGNERIIPGEDFDFGGQRSSWDIPSMDKVCRVVSTSQGMKYVTERTGDIMPVTAIRVSDAYVAYKFKIERRHMRYNIGFKVSMTKDAFGWDGAKFCFQTLFGGDGLKRYATSSRIMTFPHDLKANETFSFPEDFVFYQNPYPPDVNGREYDVLMTMRVLPTRDHLGNVVYRGGLRIHHMFIKELIPIG